MNPSERFQVSEHYEQEFKKAERAVFIDIHSEEQEESYSCGPAVVTDVLKSLGFEVDQKQIMTSVRTAIRELRPSDSKESLRDLGTPPEAIIKVLESYGIEYSIKASQEAPDEITTQRSENYLYNMLKTGHIIITPIQTIPNYQEERDINEDGHYVIVCGTYEVDGKKNFIVVDPMFHYYQRLSNEKGVYAMHMGDKIHDGVPKTKPEVNYDSVETRKVAYTSEELDTFEINPAKYGLRIVAASNFMRNWKDVSGFDEPFNQYGIAVKIKEN